jgi:TIR domain-containing protein
VADQHQLEVLQQGPDAWNTWKQQHPTTQPDLSHADLSGANLSYARVRSKQFNNIDLRTVRGLETVEHTGPSSIGIETIYRSQGAIPEVFLRKAGVPEDFLTYMCSLVNRPIEYYTCFISYSSHDQEFAERLYADLQSKGVCCWFAPEDMQIGDKFRQRIDESIPLHDKLLLILSAYSVAMSGN